MADVVNFALIWTVFYVGHVAMAADITYMRRAIRNRFSEIRNHFVDTVHKEAAKQFIYDEFKRFGLETEYNHFPYEDASQNLTGNFVNIVGVLKGSRFGTADDRIIGVGAHYDTVRNSKGVDDNGAGVAAMLEAARQLTMKKVSRNNTVMFVSFDLEEYGLIGSEEFIRTWVNPWLVRNYGDAARSVVPHGMIVLDTVMEYNTSVNSQILPEDETMKTLFPDAYISVHSDDYRGDFLALIYRAPTPDAALAGTFKSSWADSGRAEFELESLPVPYADISVLGAQAGEIRNLLRSDHVNFWADNIPAVFITDSANFRGDMKYCYHQMCDDLDTMLTRDNLNFLAKTADTIALTVNQLSEPELGDTSGVEETVVSQCLVALASLLVVTGIVH